MDKIIFYIVYISITARKGSWGSERCALVGKPADTTASCNRGAYRRQSIETVTLDNAVDNAYSVPFARFDTKDDALTAAQDHWTAYSYVGKFDITVERVTQILAPKIKHETVAVLRDTD